MHRIRNRPEVHAHVGSANLSNYIIVLQYFAFTVQLLEHVVKQAREALLSDHRKHTMSSGMSCGLIPAAPAYIVSKRMYMTQIPRTAKLTTTSAAIVPPLNATWTACVRLQTLNQRATFVCFDAMAVLMVNVRACITLVRNQSTSPPPSNCGLRHWQRARWCVC